MVKADNSSFLTLDTTFIRKGEDFRHLDYGSYFASYKGFTVDISVMANAGFDNRNQNPQMHPIKVNVPVDSWRGEVLDFGTSKQQSGITDNINMVSQEWCNYHITYNGKWRAFDGKSGLPITDGGLGSTGGVSGYSVLAEKSAGLMVTDITRCGSSYLVVNTNDPYSVTPSAAAWWLD